MKTETQEVRSKEVVVGRAEYPVYDSVSEALGALGEETALKLINAQVRTNELNRVRSAFGAEPSKERLREEAMGLITVDEFRSCAGDKSRLNDLLEKKMAEVKDSWAARRAQMAQEAAAQEASAA